MLLHAPVLGSPEQVRSHAQEDAMVPADSAGYRTGGRGRLYGCRRLLGALPCTGLKGEQDETHEGRRLMQRGEGLVPLPPVDASRV